MIWNSGRRNSSPPPSADDPSADHLEQAQTTLQSLLDDKRLDHAAKARLSEDYAQLQRLLDKIEQGHVYVAVFGRVSVGKSALLNALAGEQVFATSVLHGETKHSAQTLWQEYDSGGVYLLDTPGIDEINGEERSEIAEQVARQADVMIFVVDGDMTEIEYDALFNLASPQQPMLLVLNKVDRLGERETKRLLAHLQRRVDGIVPAEHVLAASAEPDKVLEYQEDAQGNEQEVWAQPEPDVKALRDTLWQLLKASGKSYAALNASVFADQLSQKVGAEIIATRRDIAERLIRQYALIKALGVAVNPIPVVDLLAIAADASMVVHLSKVYNIPLTRHQAGELIRAITVQMGVLLGTVYGVHALSSVLKGLTGGLSTILTAGAQAGVAFYGSYVVGKAAERYFEQGASWGKHGAKQVIKQIMDDLNKDELVEQARSSVKDYFRKGKDE
ncbi:GTP-binding protein [Suttonella sp. R2A3]|uniref:GTP-binding protein n=1 Tax=Suttonella sp. R2A3 TaxID=2908648 RepID=UPI001F19FB6A|nr:GTP-binding protein [Suttonella sp. R2A3]UJF24991.1 GTP-binding protein [Suttonella sp. R2A3]